MRINTSPPKDLAVEIEGSGPPVLMVHGLGGTSNFYQVQAQALADRFQVIRPDSAGAGRRRDPRRRQRKQLSRRRQPANGQDRANPIHW
jgi:pimeloyl-ACP methyl ester carboxylesterase